MSARFLYHGQVVRLTGSAPYGEFAIAGYMFECPVCDFEMYLKHERHQLTVAEDGALTAEKPMTCPRRAFKDRPKCGWAVRVTDGIAVDC